MQTQLNASSIHTSDIASDGIVNGRYVIEVRGYTGTLVCEPAEQDAGDDITITRYGKRFMDLGVVTPRAQ